MPAKKKPDRKTTRKKTAKKKPAKKQTTKTARKAEPVAPEIVDQTVALLLTLESHHQVATALAEKLEQTPEQAAAAINEARHRLALAAGPDYSEELGRSVSRLNNLYRRSLAMQDCKTALATQRELNRLLLYGRPPAPAADPESPGQAQIAAARAHLAPLGLAGDDAPLAELCRLAVCRIVHLEQASPPNGHRR